MRKKVMLAVLSFSVIQPAFAQEDAWKKYSKAGLEALNQHRLDDAEQN